MIWESITGAYYEQRRLRCTKINLYFSSVLVGGCSQVGVCSVAFPKALRRWRDRLPGAIQDSGQLHG